LIFRSVAPRGNVAKLGENKNLTPEFAAKIQRMEGAHLVSFDDIRIGIRELISFVEWCREFSSLGSGYCKFLFNCCSEACFVDGLQMMGNMAGLDHGYLNRMSVL
jgi:hypothetical protein